MSSKPEFTPGPWKPCRPHEDFEGPLWEMDEDDAAEFAKRPFVRIEAETCDVAVAHDLFEFKAADARLIAAAPDMFAVLERLESAIGITGLEDCVALARAALAEARRLVRAELARQALELRAHGHASETENYDPVGLSLILPRVMFDYERLGRNPLRLPGEGGL